MHMQQKNITYTNDRFGKLDQVYSDKFGHLYIVNERGRSLMMPTHSPLSTIEHSRALAESLIGHDVNVTLSQVTEPWEPQQWLYRVRKA
ncbi:MAG: hypothetical protein HRU21_07525 [Pseudomonadales bacterium]|nr:hypothetical protein [Pseudomonadales bacterium]